MTIKLSLKQYRKIMLTLVVEQQRLQIASYRRFSSVFHVTCLSAVCFCYRFNRNAHDVYNRPICIIV